MALPGALVPNYFEVMYRTMPDKLSGHRNVVWSVLPFATTLLVGHVVVPPLSYFYSPRDSDMGLWFCGGIVISELGLFGLIYSLRIGEAQWRFLAGSTLNVLIILLALAASSLCAELSKEDAIVLLALLFGISLFFGVLDLVSFKFWRVALVRQNPTPEQALSEERASSPFRFGFLFLLLLTVLSSVIALTVSQSLTLRNVSYRSFRNYYNQGAPFLGLIASFFWLLHLTLINATLRPLKWISLVIPFGVATLGTELIRQVEERKNSVKLIYLNWEFCMIVFGFVVAHVLIGTTIQWLGWELRPVKKNEVT